MRTHIFAPSQLLRRLLTTDRGPLESTAAPVLIVPGLRDSGPEHWQSRWQARHPSFRRVLQRDWTSRDLDAWSRTVADAVRAQDAPPIVAAHSFGCLAVVRAAVIHGADVRAALLVAPPDPDRLGVGPLVPHERLPFPSTLVASTDDPWMKLVKAGALATAWGSRLVAYRNAGHVNADSGFGDWPDGLRLLHEIESGSRHSRAKGGTRLAFAT